MYCDMLGVVGSSLKMVKFEPTTTNMSQHGGQTHSTCCAQQCCDMLRYDVAIVWPWLKVYVVLFIMLYKVVLMFESVNVSPSV